MILDYDYDCDYDYSYDPTLSTPKSLLSLSLDYISTPFTVRFPYSPQWISPASYISPIIRSSESQSTNHRLLPSPQTPLALKVCPQKSPQTPSQNSLDIFALSPLTPLTPPHVNLKRKLALQDQLASPTPLPRPKKLRYSYPNFPPLSPSASVSASPSILPIFTARTFPNAEPFHVSPLFPLFYRRFPASSFFQPPSSEYTFMLFIILLKSSISISLDLLAPSSTSCIQVGHTTLLARHSTSTPHDSSRERVPKK